VIGRLRNFRSPETVDELQHPSLAEALALWLLGTSWALLGLWLALRGQLALVPVVLGAGLLGIAGLKRDRWLVALPVAAVIVVAVDQVVLLWSRRAPTVAVLDLLVIGLALVTIARRLYTRRAPGAGQGPARLLPLPLAAAAVIALPFSASLPYGHEIRLAVLGLSLFHAASAAARRAARGTLAAFSLAAAWCGGMGLSAVVPAFASASTTVRAPGAASIAAIACALPLAWAAAFQSKHRWLAATAALIGTVGLGSTLLQPGASAVLSTPLDEPQIFILAIVIVWSTARLARLARRWTDGPRVERIALAATFVIGGPLMVLDVSRAGMWVVVLVALASGAAGAGSARRVEEQPS
jgi:hypothetical protein